MVMLSDKRAKIKSNGVHLTAITVQCVPRTEELITSVITPADKNKVEI